MRRTQLVFVIFVGLAVVIALVAKFGPFGGTATTQVRGLIGSEKQAFFQDQRVQDALRRRGLAVVVETAGSREIATRSDLKSFDFAFPAGAPAAEKIQQSLGSAKSYSPFYTPMVLATWKPIAELFVQQGIATKPGDYYTVDVAKLLSLMQNKTRWKDIPGNTAFPANTSVLVTSTDVRKSNSAAMYLALMSYVANGNNIVQSLDQIQPVMPMLTDLFLRQGFRPSSTQEPFDDYLVKGMGHSPIVMIYESQFIAQSALVKGSITPDMVLMYPSPTIFTKHTLISLSQKGERLADALQTDTDLQKLAVEYGFRNSDLAYFQEFTRQHGVAVPQNFIDVIEPPSYEVLEGMIQAIERAYQQQGGGS